MRISKNRNFSAQKLGITRGEVLALVVLICVLVLAIVAIPNLTHGPQTGPLNLCVNNLRDIECAKELWAMQETITDRSRTPKGSEIQPYFRGGQTRLPYCPADPKKTFESSYILNDLDKPPQCRLSDKLTNHVLIADKP